jgi:hypothetical protein
MENTFQSQEPETSQTARPRANGKASPTPEATYDAASNPPSEVPQVPGTEATPVPSAQSEVMSLKAAAAARGIGRKASVTVKTAKAKTRKPKPFEWVRVHPNADSYSIVLPIVLFGSEEVEDDAKGMQKPDEYAIHPRLLDHPDLAEDATRLMEFNLATTRKGTVFIWKHTILDKENSWIDAEEENIARARKVWVRQISDTGESTYNRREAVKSFGEPTWPIASFESLLIEALGDKFVSDENHPLFNKLLGLE